MTATTLGDLFPEMRTTVPAAKQKKLSNRTTRTGTAERLKTLYPEIESWNNVFATQAWFNWLSTNGMEFTEPEERDERFPEYLVGLMKEKMQEMGSWR
ncbi:TPA: hypothetical protein ACHF2V_004321 [Citrobacter farmeri]|jgi:hypothetical protein|uniref:hypothetical protein n=1 Tax=Citrobacter TaxID=544 RepID=UPI000E143878|nr:MULTISPECIES: hypothetical protein [Citrobacter]MEC3934080.1 hypothetical protein [Citrobacter farmeri]UBI23191.1 hypothetical protein LA348_23875 [Citrobacter amalonaticus]STA62749.1 Uncharacterised protein [Citrobacter amalonaticus]BCU51144.1 hypothetical protein CIAM_46650 [Citrobacter amalonaticus]HCD1278583.1 hypothetical protein [Citrobacter amalonaticus]